ncbi:hypothetical protein [Sinomicrobium sp.]
MKNLFFTTALILGSLMISCDTTQADEDLDLTQKKEEREITAKEMCNEKNPYDEQGVIHNELLDFYIAHTEDVKDINPDRWIAITKEFYESKKMDFNTVDIGTFKEAIYIFEEANMYGDNLILNLCEYVPFLCNIGTPGPYNPSPTWPDPFFNSEGNDDENLTDTERALNYLQSIKTEENKILENSELNDEERIALLNYTAVARYSAGYWHNVMRVQKSKSDWYEFAEQSVAAIGPCYLCDVVRVDAVATAVGSALLNDTTGAILGAYASAVFMLY